MLKVMKGDGIGIVAFAEEPRVVLPVRADYRSVASKLKSLTPSLIENQGTNIGAAIEAAALNFSSASAKNKSRVMIIISDGEAHDSAAVEAAKRCADSGITICAIGIGNPAGVPLTIDGEFIEDEEGNYVVTKLNEELMQEIASVGNGAYVRSSNEEFGLNTILKHLDEMETSTISIKYVEYKEYFQWFVGAALLILAIEALILPRRNPRLKGIHLFDRENNK
jgi:Ca-activated chloride channel family protein